MRLRGRGLPVRQDRGEAQAEERPAGKRNGLYWKEGAPVREFGPGGRLLWFGRDPAWENVLGFRGKNDADSPGQEWTKLECFCDGDTLTYRVNGTIVNRAEGVAPDHGKILLQTECAEMFVRKLELRPLPKAKP